MALFDNCVAAWKLDDLSDATGGGQTLTNNGGAGFNTGKIGNAAYFTGTSSQYLSRTSNSVLQTGDTDFTIACWAYMNNTADGSQQFVSKDVDTSGNREFNLGFVSGTNRIRFEVFRATDTAVTLEANNFGVPPSATWMCIIAWHDSVADQVGISINNGTADTSATGGALQAAGTAQFRIGARAYAANENYTTGRVDAVHKWTRVLNSTERGTFYNSGAGVEFSVSAPAQLAYFGNGHVPYRRITRVIGY